MEHEFLKKFLMASRGASYDSVLETIGFRLTKGVEAVFFEHDRRINVIVPTRECVHDQLESDLGATWFSPWGDRGGDRFRMPI